jgi:hypothetical protein
MESVRQTTKSDVRVSSAPRVYEAFTGVLKASIFKKVIQTDLLGSSEEVTANPQAVTIEAQIKGPVSECPVRGPNSVPSEMLSRS